MSKRKKLTQQEIDRLMKQAREAGARAGTSARLVWETTGKSVVEQFAPPTNSLRIKGENTE